jgi:hypothetical protein
LKHQHLCFSSLDILSELRFSGNIRHFGHGYKRWNSQSHGGVSRLHGTFDSARYALRPAWRWHVQTLYLWKWPCQGELTLLIRGIIEWNPPSIALPIGLSCRSLHTPGRVQILSNGLILLWIYLPRRHVKRLVNILRHWHLTNSDWHHCHGITHISLLRHKSLPSTKKPNASSESK